MTPALSTITWTPSASWAGLTPAAVTAAIGDLTWTEPPAAAGPDPWSQPPLPVEPVARLVRLAASCGMNAVLRIAAGGTVAGRDLIGVETDAPGGRTRVLAVTDPTAVVVVVAVEVTPHP